MYLFVRLPLDNTDLWSSLFCFQRMVIGFPLLAYLPGIEVKGPDTTQSEVLFRPCLGIKRSLKYLCIRVLQFNAIKHVHVFTCD